MKIAFEQLFYGRSERGYGILGSSPGGRAFAARIESLCGAVGTPGADYNGDSFLLSVPVGDRIVMLCGRRGEPDSIGRATLFFHALVANKAELSSAGADAFSLFSQGAFLDKMPADEIDVLSIDVAQSRAEAKESPFDVTFPCVIRSAKPAPEVTRDVVGENTLNLSWATFAFQPMPEFDVQILPPRVSCLRDLNEYDAAGRLICSATVSDGRWRDEVLRERSYETPRSPIAKSTDVTSKNKSNVMFKLSIFVNVVLAIVCGVLLASRTANHVQVDDGAKAIAAPAKLPDVQTAEIEDAAIKRFCSELKAKFPIRGKEAFLDYNQKAADLFGKYYGEKYNKESHANKENFKCEHKFLSELEIGINFVNENILKGKTQ